MSSYATVYSPMGIPLADLDVPIFRAYKLNAYAEAQFRIAITDNKCREDILRFGNLLYIRHDKLPPWVGFIDPPRRWNNSYVEVNALSAELIFDWRLTPPTGVAGETLGEMFVNMLIWANSWGGLQIHPGQIFMSGEPASMVLGGRMRDHMDKISKTYGVDWSITADIDSSNQLKLLANLYNGKRGRVTGFELNNTNTEITEPVMSEEGPIYNHVWKYSEAGSGGGRNFNDAMDMESIATFGLRQWAEQGAGSDTEGLKFQADVKLKDTAYPKNYVTPSALNVGETFNNIDLGNILSWRSSIAGFTGTAIGAEMDVRIEGYEYDEEYDRAELVANAYYVTKTGRQYVNDWLAQHGR